MKPHGDYMMLQPLQQYSYEYHNVLIVLSLLLLPSMSLSKALGRWWASGRSAALLGFEASYAPTTVQGHCNTSQNHQNITNILLVVSRKIGNDGSRHSPNPQVRGLWAFRRSQPGFNSKSPTTPTTSLTPHSERLNTLYNARRHSEYLAVASKPCSDPSWACERL